MLPQSHNMNLQCLSLLYWQTIAGVLYSFVFCLSVVFVPPSSVYYPKWTQALLDTTNLCYKWSFVSVQDWPICHEQFRGCLVHALKQQFSVFKQYYTYFHILFHLYVFSKNTNNVTRTTLPNGLLTCTAVSFFLPASQTEVIVHVDFC